ncbi:hypothetical protein LWI29_011203 [Acer saccharum]|uniref:DUF4283 domain-containing protein n=1 Tax=Acer saccharum TaxID=4024 RepID=A0AA39RZ80_ACESA|nr:hypothetical protein LWI29_011203 [Acer saccharum]
MARWSKVLNPQARLFWASVSGVPLSCWVEAFFRNLGWLLGEPLLIEDATLLRKSLDRGRILVLIPLGRAYPTKVRVMDGKDSFAVLISEEATPVDFDWLEKFLGLSQNTYPAVRNPFPKKKVNPEVARGQGGRCVPLSSYFKIALEKGKGIEGKQLALLNKAATWQTSERDIPNNGKVSGRRAKRIASVNCFKGWGGFRDRDRDPQVNRPIFKGESSNCIPYKPKIVGIVGCVLESQAQESEVRQGNGLLGVHSGLESTRSLTNALKGPSKGHSSVSSKAHDCSSCRVHMISIDSEVGVNKQNRDMETCHARIDTQLSEEGLIPISIEEVESDTIPSVDSLLKHPKNCSSRNRFLLFKSHNMKIINDKARSQAVLGKDIQMAVAGNEPWVLEEEIVKVIEKNVSLGFNFKSGQKADYDKSEWNLEEEITKVIETEVALGFDFKGLESDISKQIVMRELEDEQR